jgi:hypothetical protein
VISATGSATTSYIETSFAAIAAQHGPTSAHIGDSAHSATLDELEQHGRRPKSGKPNQVDGVGCSASCDINVKIVVPTFGSYCRWASCSRFKSAARHD